MKYTKDRLFNSVVIERVAPVVSLVFASILLCSTALLGASPVQLYKMTSLASAILAANPNPIQVCDGSGVGTTTFSWTAPSTTNVELRKDGQTGQLLYQGTGSGTYQGTNIAHNSNYYLYSIETITTYSWSYIKGRGWVRVPITTTQKREVGQTTIFLTQNGCASNTPLTISVNPGVVKPGGSYVLTAKQGDQNYSGMLDYNLNLCPLPPSIVLCKQSTGVWTGNVLVNGTVTVNLPATIALGLYKATFRPSGSQLPWSNEITIEVNPGGVTGKLYGVHSHMYWLSNQEIDANIQRLKTLGVTVSRNGVNWNLVEHTKGVYDWSKLDYIVDKLNANGIAPLLTIAGSPSWASGAAETPGVFWDMMVPTDPILFNQWVREYKKFVHDLAVRYQGKVVYWELWNEPNIGFWLPQPNVDQYATWAQAINIEIKSVNPAAQVAFGGGVTVLDGWSGMHAGDITGADFIRALYEKGLRPDIISLHPYALTQASPDQYQARDGVSTFLDIKTIKDILDSYGQHNTKVWLTEFGWDANAIGSDTQAQYLSRSFAIIKNDLPYVTMADWFIDYFPQAEWSGYALIGPGGLLTPAGQSYRNFVNSK